MRKRWWTEEPRPDGRVLFRCNKCAEMMPYPNVRLCRKYHWPGKTDGSRCQGEIARLRGELDLRNNEVLVMFGDDNAPQPHYGRVVYEIPFLVYQQRGRVQTVWRVQFEDGEEFELNYGEIREGLKNFAQLPPNRLVVLPLDRGEEGRPGALRAVPQQADADERLSEDEDAEDIGEDEDEFQDDFEGLEFLSDEDDMDPDDVEYLSSVVAPGRETTILTHILRTLQDKRGNQTNKSVVRTFNRISADFGTKLPQTWDSLLKLLKV